MIFCYQVVLIPNLFIRIFLSSVTGLEPEQFARRLVWYLAIRFSANFLFYLIRGEKSYLFSTPRENMQYIVFIITFIIAIIIIIIISLFNVNVDWLQRDSNPQPLSS